MESVKHNPDWVIQFYADMVYRIAYVYCHNKSDSEDIVQEVFMRYLQTSLPFESEEHRKAWIIRVTINCCKNLVTSAWKHKVMLKAVDVDQRNFYPKYSESIYDEVDDAVKKLKKKDRILIHLFYYEEYSVDEIAKMLDLKVSTVKTRLFRTRKKLKDILEGEESYESFKIPTSNG